MADALLGNTTATGAQKDTSRECLAACRFRNSSKAKGTSLRLLVPADCRTTSIAFALSADRRGDQPALHPRTNISRLAKSELGISSAVEVPQLALVSK